MQSIVDKYFSYYDNNKNLKLSNDDKSNNKNNNNL